MKLGIINDILMLKDRLLQCLLSIWETTNFKDKNKGNKFF